MTKQAVKEAPRAIWAGDSQGYNMWCEAKDDGYILITSDVKYIRADIAIDPDEFIEKLEGMKKGQPCEQEIHEGSEPVNGWEWHTGHTDSIEEIITEIKENTSTSKASDPVPTLQVTELKEMT